MFTTQRFPSLLGGSFAGPSTFDGIGASFAVEEGGGFVVGGAGFLASQAGMTLIDGEAMGGTIKHFGFMAYILCLSGFARGKSGSRDSRRWIRFVGRNKMGHVVGVSVAGGFGC